MTIVNGYPITPDWEIEYNAGFQSGLLHDYNDPLHAENLRKARQYHPEPLIDAYWRGYIDGKFAAIHPSIPRQLSHSA